MKALSIDRYMRDGRITVIPRKQKNRQEIFELMYDYLKRYGSEFSEAELNERIKELYDDFATMRRYLVDHQYLIRDHYGKSYQLNVAIEGR